MRILPVFLSGLAICLTPGARAADPAPPTENLTPLPPLDNSGPVKLVTASWFGGSGTDVLVSAAIGPDSNIILAGNGGPVTGAPTVQYGEPSEQDGFLVKLGDEGKSVVRLGRFPTGVTLKKISFDTSGRLFVLGDAKAETALGGVAGKGSFIAGMSPDLGAIRSCRFMTGMEDFAVDSNGDLVVLKDRKISRFKGDAAEPVWTVNWPTYGENRPGGIGLLPKSGIVAVVGYGMTHTGHEPWKDPYAYGFDREGKQVWKLWNPDPKHQADAKKFGGTGLMADTTGRFVGTTPDGQFLLGLSADGGNTVVSRDPANPREPLPASVFADVFQPHAGYGFKGASSTSVVFRVSFAGALEKGSFLCAWLTPQRANGLALRDATGGKNGAVFAVGSSAFGYPERSPWFQVPEGGYKGGGFLAAFDPDFKMLQSGYFPGTDVSCVAARDGLVVIAGKAVEWAKNGDKNKPDQPPISYPTAVFHPVQPAYGGGEKDGWFAVFRQ